MDQFSHKWRDLIMSRSVFTVSILIVLAHALYPQISKGQESFTDPRDGKKYKTIKIGDQVWMAENLNYDAGDGSSCYEGNSVNCTKYGRLYTWEAAKKSAPAGWHIPNKNEFDQLLSYLGGDSKTAYQKLTDGGSAKFNVLFGGWRNFSGNFANLGSIAHFWTSSELDDENAWNLSLGSGDQGADLGLGNQACTFSVRCIKD
jgi:uncharacterized protein (TIGR02145 family)